MSHNDSRGFLEAISGSHVILSDELSNVGSEVSFSTSNINANKNLEIIRENPELQSYHSAIRPRTNDGSSLPSGYQTSSTGVRGSQRIRFRGNSSQKS
jgi:hypothetical protein